MVEKRQITIRLRSDVLEKINKLSKSQCKDRGTLVDDLVMEATGMKKISAAEFMRIYGGE